MKDNNKEKGQGLLATLATAVVVIGGGAVILKNLSDSNAKESQDNQEKTNKALKEKKAVKDKLIKKLDEDSKKLKEDAICYYMHNLYLGEELPLSVVESIKKEYKAIYSLPYIDFLSYHLVGQEIEILDKILKERLNGYQKEQQKDIKQRYISMLQDKAKEKAVTIFEKLKKEG